jgi:surfeit locus 1 family protein
MRNKRARAVFVALTAVSIALGFFELGMWQLHRGQEVKRLSQPRAEQPIVQLRTIAAVATNLSGTAINRLVRFTGSYSHHYFASNQEVRIKNKSGESIKVVRTLDIGLFELAPNPGNSLASHDSILVVRGIKPTGSLNQELPKGVLTITGRLYPHQTSDHAIETNLGLSRIDPALIAGLPQVRLFDGYITTTTELSAAGSLISFERILTPQLLTQVPGYYWQHISYLVIWWFMALLVLIGPIYSKKVKKDRV